jgi:hypothetical protein
MNSAETFIRPGFLPLWRRRSAAPADRKRGRDAEGMAQLRAGAGAEHQRQRAEQRGQRRHHDRAEAQQRRLEDRLARRLAALALGVERKVDHHDRVLLDDADEQHDADDADDAEIAAVDDQRQQRADAGRRQGRQDGDGMDVALVEHAQHDIDGDDRRQDEQQLVGERRLEGEGGALERGENAVGHADLQLGLLDGVDRRTKRGARRQVERNGRRRELPEMAHLQWRLLLDHAGDRGERHLAGGRDRRRQVDRAERIQ